MDIFAESSRPTGFNARQFVINSAFSHRLLRSFAASRRQQPEAIIITLMQQVKVTRMQPVCLYLIRRYYLSQELYVYDLHAAIKIE